MIPAQFFVTVPLEIGIAPDPDGAPAMEIVIGPLDFRRELAVAAATEEIEAAVASPDPTPRQVELASRVRGLNPGQVRGMLVHEAQVRLVGAHDPAQWAPAWSATIAVEDMAVLIRAAAEVAERTRTFRAGRPREVADPAGAVETHRLVGR